MKLYMDPMSITTRPILLFLAENGIEIETQVVQLTTGQHLQDAYRAINPNQLVPVLEDGDLRLTESSAILKYLADTIESPAYPKDLKARAKVNEMMDWFNTNFYRDYGYNFVYPQILPHVKRRSEEAQDATVTVGLEASKKWLAILNDHWIGPDKPYLCGGTITIADYFAVGLLTLGEIIRCDFSQYPNVDRWLQRMKSLDSWPDVNQAFYGWVAAMKDQQFRTI
ncbi:MAG: glutathione S-transferase family protein [Pseudomonadota bacterium]